MSRWWFKCLVHLAWRLCMLSIISLQCSHFYTQTCKWANVCFDLITQFIHTYKYPLKMLSYHGNFIYTMFYNVWIYKCLCCCKDKMIIHRECSFEFAPLYLWTFDILVINNVLNVLLIYRHVYMDIVINSRCTIVCRK
jgi:hypothetical protein